MFYCTENTNFVTNNLQCRTKLSFYVALLYIIKFGLYLSLKVLDTAMYTYLNFYLRIFPKVFLKKIRLGLYFVF